MGFLTHDPNQPIQVFSFQSLIGIGGFFNYCLFFLLLASALVSIPNRDWWVF